MQVFLHRLDGTSQLVDIDSYSTLEELLADFPNCRAVCEGAHLSSL